MIYSWNRDLWATLHSRWGTPTGALLLAGPQGVGKRAFARALARAVLCANPQAGGEACRACASCRLFTDDSHPDFRLVEPAVEEGRAEASEGSTGGAASPTRDGSILVGQVRALTDFLFIASQFAGAKVVLIQPADRLHASAASALLKTLEEPPARTVFILVADHPQRLPPTIRSRCFRLDFPLPPRRVASDWLAAEGVEQPEIALAHTGFAPLAAVERSRDNFPSRRRTLSELLVSSEPDPAKLAAAVDSGELPLVCQLMQRWCYDLLSSRLAARVRYNPDYAEKLHRLADKADVHQLLNLIEELAAAARVLEHPLNPRLVIEHLAIQYARMFSRQPL
jgi:DNA polymerase III subunit delta'